MRPIQIIQVNIEETQLILNAAKDANDRSAKASKLTSILLDEIQQAIERHDDAAKALQANAKTEPAAAHTVLRLRLVAAASFIATGAFEMGEK